MLHEPRYRRSKGRTQNTLCAPGAGAHSQMRYAPWACCGLALLSLVACGTNKVDLGTTRTPRGATTTPNNTDVDTDAGAESAATANRTITALMDAGISTAPDQLDAATSASALPPVACDYARLEVEGACKELCANLLQMECSGAVIRVQLDVPPVYWMSTQFTVASTSSCEQECLSGPDPVTRAASWAPYRCGNVLLRLLQCMNVTRQCSFADAGEPGLLQFDCSAEEEQLLECGPLCDALPTCSDATCSGDTCAGDVCCPSHCGGYEDRFCVAGLNACFPD